jgi:hypothetical protein
MDESAAPSALYPTRGARVVLSLSAVLVLATLVGLGVHGLVTSFVTRPHAYNVLESRGVVRQATVVECRAGLGGGHGEACKLSLTYGGSTRAWVYGENTAQFDGLAPRAKVEVLVDPQQPDTVYTRTDVAARTNTGWGPVTFFSVGWLVVATALAAALLTLLRLVRRRRH